MKKLFLSHYNGDSEDVHELAAELRYRGIIPWVDKLGGFQIADDCSSFAEHAVRSDCFGLLLYATSKALRRDFIRRHEVCPAIAVKQSNPDYMLVAVPRLLSFKELGKRTLKEFGEDLSRFHTVGLGQDDNLLAKFSEIANGIVTQVLNKSTTETLGIQFSTREVAPTFDGDTFLIDGTKVYSRGANPSELERLISGMCDVKRAISQKLGRPRIRVEGFKHLSSAFAFGRVFQPFPLNIHQSDSVYWRSDADFQKREEFFEKLHVSKESSLLAVEISTRHKHLSRDVDLRLDSVSDFSRLILRPDEPLTVDNEMCCALVHQAYEAIERAVVKSSASEVHIFAAAPQSLMMMLGQKFAGMPKTYCYDFVGGEYGPARFTPAGVL